MSLCEPIRREIEFHENFLRDTLGITEPQLAAIRDAALEGWFIPRTELIHPETRDDIEWDSLNAWTHDLYILWQRLAICEKDALRELKQ